MMLAQSFAMIQLILARHQKLVIEHEIQQVSAKKVQTFPAVRFDAF
jgi:hypothetical protein